MRLITLQKDYIGNAKFLYPTSIKSDNESTAPNAYKRLFKDFYNKNGIVINKAIWCFSQLFFNEEVKPDYKHISRMLEMGVHENKYLYILNVPDKYCLCTSFYDWVDQIFKEEYPNDEPDFNPDWNNIYAIDNCWEIQCILPYINFNWIEEIWELYDINSDILHEIGSGYDISSRLIYNKQEGGDNYASK